MCGAVFLICRVGELVYYFSHHEKLCVVDNRVAAMGGLDACYGRWDTRNHPLADVHPTEFFKSLFPGQGGLLASKIY
jgi:phospholipase D1/2